MFRSSSQRGEGKIGLVLVLLVVLFIGLIGARVVPVKMTDGELKEHMEDLAKNNPRKDAGFYEKAILNRAKELDIVVIKDKVQVEKTAKAVRMQVEYTVPVDLFVFSYDWTFRHDMKRDIIIV